LPFPARTDHEALVLVKEGKIKYDEAWQEVSREAKACVGCLLNVKVAERPTAEAALKHNFFCRSS